MAGDLFTWYSVSCPRCGASIDRNCRSLETGENTHTHTQRVGVWYEEITRREKENYNV